MPSFRAPATARLMALAWVLTMPGQSFAYSDTAEEEGEVQPILVIGHRSEPETPATRESITSDRLAETVQLINTEDSLRYLPSLVVRKRHIGDTQAPLATRTSGVGASARSLIYADGVLLSALIGNNNSNASPRWGMVSPEEIERVDILYGPFAAAYPGNSIGAVVNITTRLPDKAEASLSAATSLQTFGQYGSKSVYPARQIAGTAGNVFGPLSIFVSANHVASRGQPLAYATIARPAAASSSGIPVTGAVPGVNRNGAPIFILGESGLEDQRQDNLKAKLSLALGPDARLTYVGGIFLNDSTADARSFLSPSIYSGSLNIGGRAVTLPASTFSNNVYTLDERHEMQALTLEGGTERGIRWRAIASLYDYDRDVQRIPSGALPAARNGGPGSILRLEGTGWRTLDLDARRGALAAGLHYDRFQLSSHRYATEDWRHGSDGALTQAAGGRTRTLAAWAEAAIGLAPAWLLTLGARYEDWRADRGFNYALSPALSVTQPSLSRQGLSPKASLRWKPGAHWSITASAGQAYRFPTVTELYQAISTGPTLTIPDPRLSPERARSEELAVQWSDDRGRIRLSLFNEAIRDALISQTAPLLPGSTSLFSFVQNIPRVRSRGAELVFERKDLLVPGLDLSGSATLVDGKVTKDPAFPAAEGKDLPQVPRRRATLVATWRESASTSFTLAARYSSRSFGTIDNSDPVGHAYQGFEQYLVVDARILFRISPHWQAAIGVENIGNERYYLFHPFPQRTFTGELTWRL